LKFLAGGTLTNAMKRLGRKNGKRKIAIAYWGKDALKLLKLDAGNKNVAVLCCLNGGKSDPDVIKQFKNRARQCDSLHAKVILTPNEAIVGSANASSNGMPSEEKLASGLIEAGVLVTESVELKRIESWFDEHYNSKTLSRPIRKADLDAARLARVGWPGPRGQSVRKKSLLDAMREGGEKEFHGLRIYFAMWRNETSAAENKSATNYLQKNATNVQGVLQIARADFKALTWFTDWPELPKDAFLVNCHYRPSGIITQGVCKTFPIKKQWFIKVDGGVERFTFALESEYVDFNYRLTGMDKKVIKQATSELWKIGKGDKSGKVVSLIDAAPILLKHAEQEN
jgi:hypothetical protein